MSPEQTAILKEIMEDHDGYYEHYDFDDSEYLEEVETKDWVQEHKYQRRQSIYYSTKHDVYIAVNETRSGSYHSDWYYIAPNVSLVEKHERVVTRTITEWVEL
ncbi:ribonucleotide reductase [Salmonella phage vB_SnwM_CGG4-1]|uniref:Nucleotide reductase subunit C n=1 Tax=Salmonella phage vB_SnwM_CGG4-1 TaxID=1815631 RepID=A0A1B0VV19_9CAUD|nr:ribonucleotide reductase [Salmonella phage vB_SnwM_CGG4-1]ANA49422.1 hypothetical protein CGG41_068 [Salmonella phage vB_SnwM_CGG4-1]